MKRHSLLLLVLILFPALAWGRTWTSREGKQIDGDFVDATEEAVTVKRSDGRQVSIKLEMLSDDDQRFVRGVLARRGPKKATLTEDAPAPPKISSGKIPKFGGSDKDDPLAESDADDSGSLRDDGDSTKKRPKIENRTWTDAFGRKSSGKFIRFQGNNVIVLRAGRQATFNYWELSEADQDYLKDLCEGYGQGFLIPKVNPATIAASTPAATSTPGATTTPGYSPAGGYPASGTPAYSPTPGGTTTTPRTPVTSPEELARRLRELQNNPPSPTYAPPASTSTPSYNPSGGYPTTPSTTPSSGYNPGPSYPMNGSSSTPSSSYNPGPSYPMATPSSAYTSPPTASMPTIPTITPPSMPNYSMPVMQKQCESCGAVLPANVTAGDTCPSCGVYFSHDSTNGKTAFGGGGGPISLSVKGIIVLVVLAIKAIAYMAWRSQQS